MTNSANAASSLVKGSSSAVENETETSEVKEKKKITYSKWDSAQEGSHYIQTTESTSKQIGFSLICNSYEDWCSFLDSGKVLYNVREADQEKMENGYRQRYPKSYFDQGKSLLLFSIASGSGSINATVKEMWLENDWDLNVEVDVRYPFFYTGDVVSKLYIAEVEDPLQSIQTIKVKANCLKGDSDGSFQQTESAVYVYSVQ